MNKTGCRNWFGLIYFAQNIWYHVAIGRSPVVFARIFLGKGTPELRNEKSRAWIKGSFHDTRIKVERNEFEKNEREVNNLWHC